MGYRKQILIYGAVLAVLPALAQAQTGGNIAEPETGTPNEGLSSISLDKDTITINGTYALPNSCYTTTFSSEQNKTTVTITVGSERTADQRTLCTQAISFEPYSYKQEIEPPVKQKTTLTVYHGEQKINTTSISPKTRDSTNIAEIIEHILRYIRNVV